MEYKFEVFKWLARTDGFGYPIDVYYGTVYLGLLEVEETGVQIKMISGPLHKVLIKAGRNNLFKTQMDAATALHRAWKTLRNRNEPPENLGMPEPVIAEMKLKSILKEINRYNF